MKRFWFLLIAILLLSLGLIAAGCPAADDNGDNGTETEEQDGDDDATEEDEGDESDVAGDDAEETGAPTISITTPEDGSEVAGPDVEVSVEVASFEVVNKPGEEALAGEGHIHWNVDGGGDTPTFETDFTISDLAAGEHTVQVKLHNNDHTPYEGTEPSEVTITVTE